MSKCRLWHEGLEQHVRDSNWLRLSMLGGLDDIDWGNLFHAYGCASDVPEWIRGLTASSETIRERALAELFANILHQGTVYEATAFAVPFLLEVVVDASTVNRSEVLHLLQSISRGWLDFQRYRAEDDRFVTPEIDLQLAKERAHYQAAHEAVTQGFEVLCGLLTVNDFNVRVGAAFVLATLTKRREDVATTLLDAIDREKDNWCLGALLLALLVLAQNSDNAAITEVAIRRFESILHEAISQFAALSAGIALLQLNRATAVPRVLELARPRLVEDSSLFTDIPWHETGELYRLIARSLSGMPHHRLQWIFEGLGHADIKIRESAMFCGADFCEELRWGPAELVLAYAKLVDSPVAGERKWAIRHLREMGAVGIEHLKSIAWHSLADVRTEVDEQLKWAAHNLKERKSWLVERRPLLLPSVSSLLETISKHHGSRRRDDELKVRDAADGLGFHGADAAPAIEQLCQLTQQDSSWIRVHAIRSLWKITHDSSLVVPLLQANLRPEPAAFLVVDCLKQVGAPARAVVAELRRIIDSEHRYFRSWGFQDCSLDEAFCAACAEALTVIETK